MHRIVNVLKAEEKKAEQERLQLVVVTYTKKAAAELENRARKEWLQNSTPQAMQLFTRQFFGTIHSFCLNLLKKFGHYVQLSPDLEICTDDRTLWLDFLRSDFLNTKHEAIAIDPKIQTYCSHNQLYGLLKQLEQYCEFEVEDKKEEKEWDFSAIFNYQTQNKRLMAGVAKEKEKLMEWLECWGKGIVLEVPSPTAGGEDFIGVFKETIQPVKDHIARSVLKYATCLAKLFREYRMSLGLINYADIVHLTVLLLKNPHAHSQILKENYSIILDEAQDSDKAQFEILLRIVSKKYAPTVWPFDSTMEEIERGKLCLVGDPQQSIYGARADLQTYLMLHHALQSSRNGCGLHFSVTFRCARNIVGAVNHFFHEIFTNAPSHLLKQVEYVQMHSRPYANLGQCCTIQLEAEAQDLENTTIAQIENNVVKKFLNWLLKENLHTLQARDWSDVAILCPRNDWLQAISTELENLKIPYQLHSKDLTYGDNIFYAWVTALFEIMIHPYNAYEIAGVLREVFGVKDSDIADYIQSNSYFKEHKANHPLQIHNIHLMDLNHAVGPVLKELATLHNAIVFSTPRTAVEKIVKTTNLLNRASAVNPKNTEEYFELYAELLNEAADQEIEGAALGEFLSYLKEKYNEPLGEISIQSGHIQLLSCHSAKGLEWDAVIVPFVFRPISFKDLSYPRFTFSLKDRNCPCLILDAQHQPRLHKEGMEQAQLQEIQRLLYVTLTRPRHTLVFVDDSGFFAKEESLSFGSILQLNTHKHSELFPLTPTLQIDENLNLKSTETLLETLQIEKQTIGLEAYKQAIQTANTFPKKIAPSVLKNEHYSVQKLYAFSQKKEVDPLEYGVWWHGLMQNAPWNNKSIEFTEYFREKAIGAPDPERAVTEIELLLNSTFLKSLARRTLSFQAEVPVLHKNNAGDIYEGFIDLMAHDSQSNKILLVDWKTDVIQNEPHKMEVINLYLPQIAIYADILKKRYNLEIEVYLYLTNMGTAEAVETCVEA